MSSVRLFVRRTPAFPSVRGRRRRPCDSLFLSVHANTRLLGQVGKLLGERWKALSEAQRRPYEEKAQADKKRYEEEKASYNVSLHPLCYPPKLPKRNPSQDPCKRDPFSSI